MRCLVLICCLAALAVPVHYSAGQKMEGKPKAVPTAWGKPVNGLQAGIRMKSGDPAPGTDLELQVVVRNVGRKKVTFNRELAPAYFLGQNEQGVVSTRVAYIFGGLAQPGVRHPKDLGPGEEYAVGTMTIVRVSAGLERFPFAPMGGPRKTQLTPGDYRVGAEGVELWTEDGWRIELSTGYLDATVPGEKK